MKDFEERSKEAFLEILEVLKKHEITFERNCHAILLLTEAGPELPGKSHFSHVTGDKRILASAINNFVEKIDMVDELTADAESRFIHKLFENLSHEAN